MGRLREKQAMRHRLLNSRTRPWLSNRARRFLNSFRSR